MITRKIRAKGMLERVQRRLAAILAADVVGYSRLIGQDESGTLRRLKELRRSLIEPAIKEHRGRVVKTTGDGILIEFPSAVDAVRCAVTVQRAMAETEGQLPADRRIAFRIGVHQGDVVVENEDLFGDGVNVAARLETLSEPGGICVSSRVHEDTIGRLDLPFEDRGEQQVKSIARPIRVYSLGIEAIAGLPSMLAFASEDPPKSAFARWLAWVVNPSLSTKSQRLLALLVAALVLFGIGTWQVIQRFDGPNKVEAVNQLRGPTLAVLPFDNLSGDPSQDFFSQGISEELITILSRFDHLRVLARNTTFVYKGNAVDIQELGRKLRAQYVIEGSFGRVPDQLSVTAQLIDTSTGSHIWAQTYERQTTSTSLLAIQDDIAQRIGAAVRKLGFAHHFCNSIGTSRTFRNVRYLSGANRAFVHALMAGPIPGALMSIREMKRRAFIAALGGAAAWPLVGRAQQPERISKIGVLWPGVTFPPPPRMEAFRQALRQLGYVEGQNVAIELR
jgi:adenylate cyclase